MSPIPSVLASVLTPRALEIRTVLDDIDSVIFQGSHTNSEERHNLSILLDKVVGGELTLIYDALKVISIDNFNRKLKRLGPMYYFIDVPKLSINSVGYYSPSQQMPTQGLGNFHGNMSDPSYNVVDSNAALHIQSSKVTLDDEIRGSQHILIALHDSSRSRSEDGPSMVYGSCLFSEPKGPLQSTSQNYSLTYVVTGSSGVFEGVRAIQVEHKAISSIKLVRTVKFLY